MFKRAGIEGNFTNHSGKRICATMLFDARIDEQVIMSRTGHCSENELRQYKRATPAVIARTSVVLDPPQCPAKRIKTETVTCTETQHVPKFCHICSRSSHDTRECWFNGRSNGWSNRNNQ